MKTINYDILRGLKPLDNMLSLASIDDILFFDIETTGLSKKSNHIYLIGCGYYSDEGLHIIQWFAENENEEVAVLKAFSEFASSFSCLINYNGKSFDIPFTKERMEKYGISMPELNSVDLYTIIKPLRRLLSLHDLTLKSVESFLGIKRDDKYNGGELISVYKDYVRSADENKLKLLLLHNREDVQNMHSIVAIFDYGKISPDKTVFKEYIIKEYSDYNGNSKEEILLSGLHNTIDIPKGFNTFKNSEDCQFIMNFSASGEFKVRIPVLTGTLNYYLNNYKDYYYLPKEDICILKSMAGGVLRENRENATKETCKITLEGVFIPLFDLKPENNIRIFKSSYKSKSSYIRLNDFKNSDQEFKTQYLRSAFAYFL